MEIREKQFPFTKANVSRMESNKEKKSVKISNKFELELMR
jgi:hypothetical protein